MESLARRIVVVQCTLYSIWPGNLLQLLGGAIHTLLLFHVHLELVECGSDYTRKIIAQADYSPRRGAALPSFVTANQDCSSVVISYLYR